MPCDDVDARRYGKSYSNDGDQADPVIRLDMEWATGTTRQAPPGLLGRSIPVSGRVPCRRRGWSVPLGLLCRGRLDDAMELAPGVRGLVAYLAYVVDSSLGHDETFGVSKVDRVATVRIDEAAAFRRSAAVTTRTPNRYPRAASRQRHLPRRRERQPDGTPSSGGKTATTWSWTPAVSTEPMSTANRSNRCRWPTATRFRWASSVWCSSPGPRRTDIHPPHTNRPTP